MKRLLYPMTAIITFTIGVSSAAIWEMNRRKTSPAPKVFSAFSTTEPATPIDPETEQYAVYSALIKDMYLEDDIKQVVIKNVECRQSVSNVDAGPDQGEEDTRRGMEEWAIKQMPALKRQTFEDFHRDRKCYSLTRKLDVLVKYVLVTNKDLGPLFPEGEFDRWWRRFYARYPDSSGIINFSHIAFDREMNQALVVTRRSCGGLCGAGYFVLLTKDRGLWRVQNKVNTWVS